MENTSQIRKLSSSNDWKCWKFQVTIVLKSKGLYKWVDAATPSSERGKGDDFKAQEILISSINQSLIHHVINCKNAHEIWSKLGSIYEQDDSIQRLKLQQSFFNYTWKNVSVASHISDMENLAQSLNTMGDRITDELLMTKILMTLPPKYANFQTAWDSVEQGKKTLKNLTERLCLEESRIKLHTGHTAETNTGHMAETNDSALLSKIKCFSCGKRGHIKKDCDKRKFQAQNSNPNHSSSSKWCSKCKKKNHNLVDCWFKDKSKGKDNAFIVQCEDENCVDWFIDSGATAHMCNNIKFFTDIQPVEDKHVLIGNGQGLKVVGVGTIIAETYDGDSWIHTTLSNVNYVPEMKYNLFSTEATLQQGYEMTVNNNTWTFTRNDEVCAIGVREGKLFKMQLRINKCENEEAYLSVSQQHSLYDWHCILGHQNVNQVKQILKRSNITPQTSKNETFFCEACIFGKQSRQSFGQSSSVTKQVGDLIVADVCGPMEATSVGGSKYFLLLKDDFSKFRSVYFLKSKLETKQCIINYLHKFENQTGKKVKIIRTDNGLDEVNKEVKSVTDSLGIIHQKSCPYTPQQNGRAERDMRTIVEGARTVLHANGLSKTLWAEAINYFTYTLNYTLCTENGTPHSVFTGNQDPLDLNKFHSFGSNVYVHIADQKRRKWDKKSQPGMFVGYDNDVKGYRIYFKHSNKVELSRDVIFEPHNIGPVNMDENNVAKISPVNDSENVIDNYHVFTPASTCNNMEETNNVNVSDHEGSDFIENEIQEIFENQENQDIDIQEESEPIALEEGKYNLRNRNNLKNRRFDDYVLLIEDEPSTFEEAMSSPDSDKWKEAVTKELNELRENNTWIEVEKPKDENNIVTSKWIFKKKFNGNNIVFKARLVARGFQQKDNFDFVDLYAPVAKLQTLRVLLAVAVQKELKIHQMDVIGAFLHGDIDECVYMKVPEGLKCREGNMLKLQKSIYGLKKSPKYWNDKLNHFFIEEGFSRSQSDMCLYTKDGTYILVYVDDILIFSSSETDIVDVKSKLKKEFKMKDLNEVSKFLGMEIIQKQNQIVINQSQYMENLLKKYNMQDCKPVSTPIDPNYVHEGEADMKYESLCRSVIGGLLYLSLCSRPDISIAIGILSRHQHVSNEYLWKALKRVLRYIKGTLTSSLVFSKNEIVPVLEGFADADWAGDKETRKSTSGFLFKLYGCSVVWCTKRQASVSLSTAEAEYIALSEAIRELLWIVQILKDLNVNFEEPITIFEDNQAAIKMTVAHITRSKHIDIRYHFIREKVQENFVKIKYIESREQLADIFTKPIPYPRLAYLKPKIGIEK